MKQDRTDGAFEIWGAELPGAVGDEWALAKRAGRLSALMARQVDVELAKLGLTKAENDILSVLRASGAPYRLRPSDLAQRLMLSSGGMSNLLRRLAAGGLVERDPDPSDARSSWVFLTDRGVKTAEESVRAAAAAQAAYLREVPPETTRAALDALREVLIALGDTP
ncbi:MarR family winged helix-turn-helix transcriptional regulator [Cryptosporangium sp. NPDC048952]|uniref:MarR family winged helix-turn-helix transcriptional regulator n=1 Tax=Cryptosporangium sp. NPDC048952 TaxID=3363961 RepID=UPI0037140F93